MNLVNFIITLFCLILLKVIIVRGLDISAFKFETKLTNKSIDQNDVVTLSLSQGFNISRGLSICFRISLKYWRSSCFLQLGNDLALSFLDYSNQRLSLQLGETLHSIPWPKTPIQLFTQWNSFCIAYDGPAKTLGVYANGVSAYKQTNLAFSSKFNSSSILTIGSIDLSQLRFHGFFFGQLTDVNVWSRPLNVSEIQIHQQTCNGTGDDPAQIISGSNYKIGSKGNNVEEFKINKLDPCRTPVEGITISPFGVAYDEGSAMCSKLGGSKIPLPMNQSDTSAVVAAGSLNSTITCQSPVIWLPIKRLKAGSTIWSYDITGKKINVTYLPWAQGQPNDGNSGQDCVNLDRVTQQYYDYFCDESICYPCLAKSSTVFTLKGLDVGQTLFDTTYLLLNNQLVSRPNVFHGITGRSIISFNSTSKSWRIESTSSLSDGSSNLLGIYNGSNVYPIGFNAWYLRTSGSGLLQDFKLMRLKLNKCTSNEFGCFDGTCISINLRCDEVSHCKDGSDEIECDLFNVDLISYRRDYPPKMSGTEVRTNITLYALGPFDEIQMTFKLKFLVSVMWYDSRLNFYNLINNNGTGNVLSNALRIQIWYPRLIFGNSIIEKQINLDQFSSIVVLRKGKPTLSLSNRTIENQLYPGSQNPFLYKRVYELDLRCNFELQNFPFDFQRCYLRMEEPLEQENTLIFTPENITCQVFNTLTQFRLINFSIASENHNNRWPRVVLVEIGIQRIFLHHLTNTFIPMSSLLVIAEITLFFPEQQTLSAVGMVLTIMLVMYTMYQSVNATLPKTAYLKFIDAWLIFCLLTPFVVFVFEIGWELNRIRLQRIAENKINAKNNWVQLANVSKKHVIGVNLRTCCQFFIPCLTVLYIVIYVIIAINLSKIK